MMVFSVSLLVTVGVCEDVIRWASFLSILMTEHTNIANNNTKHGVTVKFMCS